MLCPSSPQWLQLLIGHQFLGVVPTCNSQNPVLLHYGVAIRAPQLVGGVRLKRVPAAVGALVSLRHDLPP